MENLVSIIIVISLLLSWIAWLVYNYAIAEYNIKENSKTNYYKNIAQAYKNKYEDAQLCIDDLIKTIKVNFPQSTIKYTIDKKGNQLIEGKIAH